MSAVPACELLVLCAHGLELSGLRRRLGDPPMGLLGGVAVACEAVGVGLPAAGAGTARALLRHRPRAAVLLGSYGVYPSSGGTLLELFVPTGTRLLCADALLGAAALPGPMMVAGSFDPALQAGLRRACPDAASGELGTTLSVTTDDRLAARLGRAGTRGENLEALAVALACADQGVPLGALLGATNRVGSEGRAQWAAHHEMVAESTASVLAAFVGMMLGTQASKGA